MVSRLALILLVSLAISCAAPSASDSRGNPPASAATRAPSAAPAAKATTAPQTTPASAACAATYTVPGNAFRSDDPAKLTASTKPKLVEFFAYW